jgi:type IV secretion system protein VirB9
MRSTSANSRTRARRTAAVALLAGMVALLMSATIWCDDRSPSGAVDERIRVFAYGADEVYRLKGYVGYQIDVEFEAGETFVGLGTGDLDSLTFAAQDNHLFLKPKAGNVDTNLTVLTTRRAYHFDYAVSDHRPDSTFGDVIYVLRFTYPSLTANHVAEVIERQLSNSGRTRWHNSNYSYRGSAQLKPESVWDDSVQTRLRFGSQRELPAIFARNDDGSESLVNFTIDAGEVVVHRVSRHFVVRRGGLEGCIVNAGFTGEGERLESGTVAPGVERMTKGARP